MSVKQGDYLRRLRAENGLSQEKLAEKLGVSRQSVSKWEQGYAVPDTDNMMKLSKLYSISVDDILNCAQSPQKQTVQEQPEKEQPPREDAKAPAAFKPAEPAFAAKKKKRSWLFLRLSVFRAHRNAPARHNRFLAVEKLLALPFNDTGVLHCRHQPRKKGYAHLLLSRARADCVFCRRLSSFALAPALAFVYHYPHILHMRVRNAQK